MKLVFHGAAKEVGRSCIEVKTNGERYLLDAGIKFKEHGFEYPEAITNLPAVDGLFISHAHLDHSGALPMFEHQNIICPVFMTKLTYELTKILLKDSYKIARIKNLHPAFNKIDLTKVSQSARFIKYDEEYKHRDIHFVYRNAGHVPGSAMMELTVEGKKILYTGDYKVRDTELMKGCHTEYHDIDVLITETTYGNRGLPERGDIEKRFLDATHSITSRGGSVLVPVFSLGRAQEILLVLSKRKFDVPIYFDGMCHKMAKKMLQVKDDKYLNHRAILEQMINKQVQHISSERRRMQAMSKPGIFVSTSGMLQGGPVMSYLKEMWHEPKNAIFLMGFQCKRTNGRHLYEDHYVYIDGWKTDVNCQVDKFDFSGHSDQDELKEFIRKVNPKTVIFQHGDETEIEVMREWASKELKCKVYAPKVGDEIEF